MNAFSGSHCPLRHIVPGVLTVLCGLLASQPAAAQPIPAGAAYLAGSQQTDGSWGSAEVRRVQATGEALRALQAVAQAPTVRSSAADYLQSAPVEDSDDRARRIAGLAAEGRSVTGLVTALLADADPEGGWGLTSSFAADPLDTSLGLSAVAAQPGPDDNFLRTALIALLSAQKADGGWPCVQTRDGDADSEIFCTSQALLALTAHRGQFYLDPQIDAAVSFLRGKLNANGSFGPTGANDVIHTALASRALASVPAFGNEVAVVISWLQGRQQPDGSWGGDPYPTALALQALQALSGVRFCGDGAVNRPGEACDGSVPAGLTCQGVGMGSGTLACSPQCTLDTSGCSAPPVCGDNLRNQPFEICDGTDLASQTCQTQGFATGNLACAADCLSFNVSGCNAAPTCGDGVVNQPGESCDLNDFHGTTCTSLGLGGGQLGCTSDCNFDTSQCDSASFVIDNKGREFFVGFLANLRTTASAQIHLTSEIPTSVTIQYPVNSPSFSQTVSVTPGQVRVVNLPNVTHNSWTAGRVLNNAVRVSSPDEFVVYLVNRDTATSDAAMALPVDALGTSYIVTTYRGSAAHSGDRSEFLVIAPFDGTTVTITPAATLRMSAPTPNAPPNVPFQITLNRGQGFRGEALSSTGDLTGTLIESDRPVAVLNGNICTNIPTTTLACDHVFEVAHPLQSWGDSALVANLPNRTGGTIYRVVASVDGTQVFRNGVLQATLNKGKFLETGPLTGSHFFSADQPIFVTQFMTGDDAPGATNGDPAMANMIPPDQYLESYTFSTVGGAQFSQHFLTLIAPATAVGSVQLDGTPVAPAQFTPIGSSGFSSALLPLGEGSHTTSSPQPHGITVEGLNSFDSYIYPGGARLEFINQFCGDGSANREAEACDGTDFRGSTCASFGFASGFLQCTADCRIDTSQCAGFTIEDKDDDGYPATEDCDDTDPEVNPGMPEIPGNGIDDDCNPATPDTIPQTVSCEIFPDRLSYAVTDLISLASAVRNDHATFTIPGVSVALAVRSGGTGVYTEARDLAPLPPGARSQQSWALSASQPAGSYTAELTVSASGQTLATCSAGFTIAASAGNGLAGNLTLNPEKVNAGDSSNATYTVENRGNATLTDLAIRVILVHPVTGSVVAELTGTATLQPGQSFTNTQPFSSVGLDPNTAYLAVLLAKPAGTDSEQTLDSATLTVVNAPPVCSTAVVTPSRIWPPNHKLVKVSPGGVTDPDGDPVTVKVTSVYQDERTDHTGDGKTCPDTTGVGTAGVSLRAERSGQLDGRVYHLSFQAEDGRGGRCEGQVTVCVPHDNNRACVDQGALYDSTVCE
ncbi:MAG: prenyltransferase/squalene oxidase repeat-containing protein [Acidobacteriota bacterium]